MADENIVGNYRLVNMMMSGQSSQVWEVVELTSHRHFAMKILLPEKAKNAADRRFLFHEANVGKTLAHPNVIKIVYVSTDPKVPYFVMEYFPAGSLKLRIVRKQYDFIQQHIETIFQKAATAFAYMNASGWVHRDVKPDNILVNSAGEVRIIDFALAQRVSRGGLFSSFFRSKMAAGTHSYISPEQILCKPLDGRADIYSFGCAMYETACYRPPFRGTSNTELLKKHLREKPSSPQLYNRDLTDEFCELVLHTLAKKREDRPKDFHQVLMKLRTIRVYKSSPKPQTKTEG